MIVTHKNLKRLNHFAQTGRIYFIFLKGIVANSSIDMRALPISHMYPDKLLGTLSFTKTSELLKRS
jgi:hypothetical protein